MPFEVYKLIHVSGAFLLIMSFAGASFYFLNGGEGQSLKKKFISINHGIGLFLLLLGGFGMLARLGIHWPWPGWVFVKFGIWLIFGGYIVLLRKKSWGAPGWFLGLGLAAIAVATALFKPLT